MAEAKLYGQNKGSQNNLSIKGIIKDYYAYAGENISAGDLVEFMNGVSEKVNYGASVDKRLNGNQYSGHRISAVVLDDTRVFIAHSNTSSYYMYGVVCKINGVTITTGADTKLLSGSSIQYGQVISAVKVGDNKVFIAHNYAYLDNDYYLDGLVVTIDGTTITPGANTQLLSTTHTGDYISACTLSDDKVFVAHSYGSNLRLYAMVCTISGTTITKGTDTQLSSTNYTGRYGITTNLMPNGNIFVAHAYYNNVHLYAMVCTISGTTISKGSDTVLSSNGEAGHTISTTALSDSKFLIVHSSSSKYYLHAMICTVSGTSVSHGNDTSLFGTYSHGKFNSVVALSDTKAFLTHSYHDSLYNVYTLYAMILDISGTTITVIDHKDLLDDGATETQVPVLLNNGSIFLAYNIDNNKYYLHAQIWAVDKTTNKITNTLEELKYETQVRKVTTAQCYGISKTGGSGGDDTGHKDLISVYRPSNSFNLIPDCSFEKDMWSGANYSNSKSHSEKRSLYFPTGTTYVANIEIPRPIVGHKYYGRRFIKTAGDNQPGDYRFEVWGADGANMCWTYAENRGNYPDWTLHSAIHEITAVDYPETDRTIIRCFNVNTTADTWVDDLLLLDLTDIFGAGKEPTKEWCDKNL